MAEEVQIQNSPDGAVAKIRSPLGVALLTFTIVYIFVWWYKINKEMVEYGRAKGTDELGDSPGKSLAALFPGGLIIVPGIMTNINTAKRTQAAARLAGRPEGINGWIALILYLVISPAYIAYLQSDLNETWEAQAASGGALPSGAGGFGATTATDPAVPVTPDQPGPTPGS